MKISKYTALTWRKAVAALIPVTFVCAVLATFVLDALMMRPTVDGGSVNTLLPGITYAMAAIMKVCLFEGLILLMLAFLSYAGSLRGPAKVDAPNLTIRFWTTASLMLAPFAIVVGAVTIMIAQGLAAVPDDAYAYTFFSRNGVLAMLICLVTAAVTGVVALLKRESPMVVPILSIITATVLTGLFWHFEFYAIGFHQDNWAPPH
jgi:hypothetical protein